MAGKNRTAVLYLNDWTRRDGTPVLSKEGNEQQIATVILNEDRKKGDRLRLLPNSFKDNDRSPDFIAYEEDPKYNKQSAPVAQEETTSSDEVNGDEIPF